MNRILVIVLAIAAGISLGIVLARLQARRQQRLGQTTYVDEGKRIAILPWLVGLVVLFFGLLWLANDEPGDITSQYNPAQLQDSELIPPYFSNRSESDTDINATSAPIILPPSSPLSLPPAPPLPLPSSLPSDTRQ